MICPTSAHGISTAGPSRAVSLAGRSRKQDARMVGAECELAPGERDHRHGGEDDADQATASVPARDQPGTR